MKSVEFVALSVCVLAFTPVGFAADGLELHCPGSAVAIDIENSTAVSRDSDKNRSTAVIQTLDTRPFDGAVDLKLDMGSAKIRIPPGMYPSIRVSDKIGWLNVTDVIVNEREITGTFKITIMSKPEFRIDRVTGEITASSSSVDFTGACAKVATRADRSSRSATCHSGWWQWPAN